ncbi:class I SAM-dependent methyltransferase [Conexibacter woesei]|uniref:Methyltransferase type 11 n=1 Tax=Conexibacter woesei (strain DSM 14684 / CCUG 47730 / CIP 108061 / JCM 11494 / NBRC 100937 / ID131577) TaxID=469383 RepID=D3EZM4_CONWI|nr:class I SAM-dependent methyltransferase [Conexibacter woesei]ADB53862.1 Methyltransferase type 11 [Conexibacter woesei DSM 14684]
MNLITDPWEARLLTADDYMLPWIESAVPLAGKTVLEYGCGYGPVACALGTRVGQHYGYDIDPGPLAKARDEVARRGLDNVELRHVPVESILAAVEEHAGEIDVFLFYAVLEHLNVEERLEVLSLARRVVRPDGAIVICETPNRLILWDWHSSQAPFFAQLPDELALRYYDRAPRQDFVDTIRAGVEQGPEAAQEALTRFGRGMSFHELELVFGDLSRHVLASGWEPSLLPSRAIHPEEVALARTMDQARPDLAPAFSRYWIDVVLSASPIAAPPPMLRPWPMHTLASPGAEWTGAETVRLPTTEVRLVAPLPARTRRIAIGALPDNPGPAQIRLADRTRGTAQEQPVDCGDGWPHYATFRLPHAVDTVEIALDRPGQVTFVGYDS